MIRIVFQYFKSAMVPATNTIILVILQICIPIYLLGEQWLDLSEIAWDSVETGCIMQYMNSNIDFARRGGGADDSTY